MSDAALSEKLGELRIGLRPELEFTRHVFREEVSYVVRDPITFDTHRFSLEDYRVLAELRGDVPLKNVLETLIEQETLDEDQQDDFYRFVLSLHQMGFVRLPFSEGKKLYDKYMQKLQRKKRQRISGIFFLRIPVMNPNRLLEALQGLARPFFTRWALAVWCVLVAIGATLAIANREELMDGFTGFLSPENLLILWLTVVGLKICHEAGHAFACKVFGGHVPETGIYLMCFTPCAYVDATASWGFPSKYRRLAVCFAGMYVELAIACVAVILWTAAEPGTARSLLHNVIVLASVVTVGFNANPLMRYDGYYALVDMVEIPNLRQRSQDEFQAMLKRWLLGIRRPDDETSTRMSLALSGFGVAGALYRVLVVLGISAVIASKFFLIGILLGTYYMLSAVIGMVVKSCRYLWFSEETSPVRVRAVTVSLAVVLGAGLILFRVPVPARVHAQGLVSSEEHQVVRAEIAGVVEHLNVRAGDRVRKSEVLARFSDFEREKNIIDARYDVDESQVRWKRLRTQDHHPAEQEKTRLGYRRKNLASRLREMERLTIRAPQDGLVTHCLPFKRIGEQVEAGEIVAEIHRGKRTVEALLSASEVSRSGPEIGDRVEFRGRGRAGESYFGSITQLQPAGQQQIEEIALTTLSGGGITVDPVTGRAEERYYRITVTLDPRPDLPPRPGMTGVLRLDAESEAVGLFLFRRILTFINRLALS